MRLRVHDDGRWVVLADPGDDLPWMKYPLHTAEGTTVPGVTSWLSDSEVHFDGWRELVVLDPDADAQRLAKATGDYVEVARAVLDRLAAGTEGERDG